MVTLGTITTGDPDISLGSPAAATVTIVNDDIPVLTINDPSVDEGDSGTTDPGFFVTSDLAVAPDAEVSFEWAAVNGTTDAADLVPANINGSLSFIGTPAGETIAIPVLIQTDTTLEPDETYTVVMSNGVIAGTSGTPTISDNGDGTIRDDDSATVSIAATDGQDFRYGVHLHPPS